MAGPFDMGAPFLARLLREKWAFCFHATTQGGNSATDLF